MHYGGHLYVFGMEEHNTFNLPTCYTTKPQFNPVYYCAVKDWKPSNRMYTGMSLDIPVNHDLYISSQNHAISILQLIKSMTINVPL